MTFHLVILIKGSCNCWKDERQDISGYSTHNRIWQRCTEVIALLQQLIVEPCAQVNMLEECLIRVHIFSLA